MEELGRKSVEDFKQAQKTPVVVVLDNIRSMHNVGSIFRTADAFLLESIVLCGFTPQPPHREIHKTALGATETVEWVYEKDIVLAVQKLKSNGYTVLAIEQTTDSIFLNHCKLGEKEKIAVILGNEVDGVSAEALQYCDASIEIPQLGMKHSLNVSVAGGIVLWELFKQLQH